MNLFANFVSIMDISQYLNEASFVVSAVLGGIAHYLKKVARKETTATMRGWFGKDNLAATIYTIIVFFAAIVGALAGDIINSQTGFWATLYTGFATGFAIDAGFNSDKSLSSQISSVKTETDQLVRKDGKINRRKTQTTTTTERISPAEEAAARTELPSEPSESPAEVVKPKKVSI